MFIGLFSLGVVVAKWLAISFAFRQLHRCRQAFQVAAKILGTSRSKFVQPLPEHFQFRLHVLRWNCPIRAFAPATFVPTTWHAV
jgi:hypothetical protein